MTAAPAWPADSVPERRPIKDLVPYARNARIHSDEQIAQLAASMREFGVVWPALVDEAGEIIAGHGRILAAEVNGLTDYPVIVARGWTKKQIKAYRIADNQLALNAIWDVKLLAAELGDLVGVESLIGFSEAELQNIFLDRADGETDAAAEWQGMPEFYHVDKRAFRSIVFHFPSQKDVDDLAVLIGQKITDKTRFVWYPRIEIERYADKRYVDETPA